MPRLVGNGQLERSWEHWDLALGVPCCPETDPGVIWKQDLCPSHGKWSLSLPSEAMSGLASTQTLSCKDQILLSLIQRDWLHSTAEKHRIMELFRLGNTSKVIESNSSPSQGLFCSRAVVWLKAGIPWVPHLAEGPWIGCCVFLSNCLIKVTFLGVGSWGTLLALRHWSVPC